MLHVGDRLGGFCEGHFGRDSYEDKMVEAVGFDWVVVQNLDDHLPEFAPVDPQALEKFVVEDR